MRSELVLSEIFNIRDIQFNFNQDLASVKIGSANRLLKLQTNCKLTFTEELPALNSMVFTQGFRPNKAQGVNILEMATSL